MTLFASAVMSQNDHGYEAGRYVATHILAAFERTPPLLLIACITNHYRDPAEVVRGIRSIVDTIPLVGLCSPRVITAAGIITRGVAVLGLRSETMQVEFAIESGSNGISEATLERMLAANEYDDTTDASTSDYTTMLALSNGHILATQPAGRLATHCAFVQVATTGDVFVNDQVIPAGVALAWIRSAEPVTIVTVAATPDALSSVPNTPRAALLFDCALFDTDADSPVGNTPTARPSTLDSIRANIGYATPLLGATGLQAVGLQGTPDAKGVWVML